VAYLGNKPSANLLTMNSQQFNGDGSTTDFVLNQPVTSTSEIEVFVGNVRQDPFSSYSISGTTTLAFTTAPVSGTANIYVVFQGKAVGNVEPGANSIEFGMIKSINGGYQNLATVTSPITVAATDNMLLTGPVSFTGTVTVNGNLTIV
tara:strand:+ start:612 stop:1055 length:444 start_codon:yes stop_codon:yes gene_type:complete